MQFQFQNWGTILWYASSSRVGWDCRYLVSSAGCRAADHLSSSECAQNKGSYWAQHSTWCMILSQSFGNNLDKYAFFHTDDIFEMHVNFVQNIYGWMTTKSRSRLLFKNLDICSPRQKYKAIRILNTNLQWWTIFPQQALAKQWGSILDKTWKATEHKLATH